jgi:hypothetical protein
MRAILHRRDSERTQFSIPFGNEDAFERLRLIVFYGEVYNGLRFLLRRVRLLPVHTGSAPTGVLCHTPNSEATRAA